MVGALFAGAWPLSRWQARITDQSMRANLLEQTVAIAEAIHPDSIGALAFTADDANRPPYHALRQQLIAYRQLVECRGIWTMARRADGRLAFGPESYEEGDPQHSPPGTEYEDATDDLREFFDSGRAFTEGPCRDEYGVFISAIAPVFDPRSGRVLMAVGLDVEAGNWLTEIRGAYFHTLARLSTLGVVVAVGVLVLQLRRRLPVAQRTRIRHVEAVTLAVFGLVLTAIVAETLHKQELQSRRAMFGQLANTKKRRIAARATELAEFQLSSLVRLFDASNDVTREEFAKFAAPLVRQAGIQSVGWVTYVPSHMRAEVERQASGEFGREFSIRTLDPAGGGVRAGDGEAHFPIWFVEPAPFREALLGVDLGSQRECSFAMRTAWRTGLPTATSRISGVADCGPEGWVFVFYPAYGDFGSIRGFAMAALDLRSFLQPLAAYEPTGESATVTTLQQLTPAIVGDQSVSALTILNAARPHADQRIGESAPRRQLLSGDDGMSAVFPLFVFGNAYALAIHPGPAFLDAYATRAGPAAAAVGVVLTALVTAFACLLTRRQSDLEHQVHMRTSQLSASTQRLEHILQITKTGIDIVDVDFNLRYVDPGWQTIYGDPTGRKCFEYFMGRQTPCDNCAIPRALETRQIQISEEVLPLEGGRVVEVHTIPFQDAQGEWLVSEFNIDITQRKRAEMELREVAQAMTVANCELQLLNLQAQEATRAKSEFLANMSHEIRTPMTAILGYAGILADNVTNPDQLDAVNVIRRNGDHLLTLINQILDLSKVESGKLQIERVYCSPREILGEVISLIRVRAREKGLPLVLRYGGALPDMILTDPTRLRQILVNLVGNAIKFTQTGEVRVMASLAERPDGSRHLVCEVMDSGIGMTEEQIATLFQPFHQVDSSTSRQFGGTGLGLAISKRLAEVLGGSITVRSEPGNGSTFRMWIDAGPAMNAPEATGSVGQTEPEQDARRRPDPSAPTDLAGVRVLLAEDGADNQRLISHLLRKAGAKVVTVENGRLAVEHALRRAAIEGQLAEPFHVILMDMQMPVLDGYAATRELRLAGYSAPIVALTAHAMAEDRQKCLDAGCDDYATKPVDRHYLLQIVAEWAAAGQAIDAGPPVLCHESVES